MYLKSRGVTINRYLKLCFPAEFRANADKPELEDPELS